MHCQSTLLPNLQQIIIIIVIMINTFLKNVSSPLMGLFRITKQTNSNEHNMVKNPNWKEAISWLFTSVAKDLNSGQL